MSNKNANVLIVCVSVVLISIIVWSCNVSADQGVIEMTKEEALAVQNANFAMMAAQADLNEILGMLALKYRVAFGVEGTHNLDLRKGLIVPRNDINPEVTE